MIYFFPSRTDFTQYNKPQSLHAPDNGIFSFFGIAECIPESLHEILRILTALQTTDAFGVSTPVDWTPGLPVIEPAPQTVSDVKKRINLVDKNEHVQSWYLTFRELPKTKIYEKLYKGKK